MDIFILIASPLIIAFGAYAIFTIAKKENSRKSEKLNRCDFVARSTHTWGVIMIALEVLLALLLILGNIEKPFGVGMNVVLGALALIFALGILQNFREKIHIVNKTFTVTPTLGKKKQYSFSDIEKIDTRKTGYLVLVDGKKVATLDPGGIGTMLFVEIYKTLE